jgi:hypothetical protein
VQGIATAKRRILGHDNYLGLEKRLLLVAGSTVSALADATVVVETLIPMDQAALEINGEQG